MNGYGLSSGGGNCCRRFKGIRRSRPRSPRATALVLSYPTPEMLTRMFEAERPELPEGLGDSVDGARALLEEVQFGGHGSPETNRNALFTLRHFP